MNQQDIIAPPLTGMPRLIQLKEHELATIPEKVRYHLATGTELTQVEEWAAEKRTRLHAEIAALHAKIAARQRKASGQEHKGSMSTSIPGAQKPAFVEPTILALRAAVVAPVPTAKPVVQGAPVAARVPLLLAAAKRRNEAREKMHSGGR